MTETTQTEAAKKAVEADAKVAEKSRAEFAERTKGKPTPTQAENDLAMHNGFVTGSEHEADGSNPDPHNFSSHKDLEADKAPKHKPQTYQTKEQTAR